jgi:iron(III) transport system permease protein
MSLAVALCWVLARTNTPARAPLEFLLYLMWVMPVLPTILSWILLASPRAGYLNVWFGSWLPFGFRFNAYSYEALVILTAVYSAPLLFVIMLPAFLNMDTNLEEAAQVSGAGLLRRLVSIVLPLLRPALVSAAALSLVLSLESFEAARLLGTPAGIFVFANRIYDLIYMQVRPQFGAAAALAMVLLVITVCLVLLQRLVLSKGSFTTVTGKGYRPRPVDLGRWRWLSFTLVMLFIAVFGLLPLAMLFLNSLVPVTGFLRWELLTWNNWREVLTSPGLTLSITNTLVVGCIAATIGLSVVTFGCYLIARTKWSGRAALDMTLWLPVAVPSMVLALGFLWAFVRFPIYGTLAIIILATVVRGLPNSSRIFVATMVQISRELEEAAWVHGVRWPRAFSSVMLPLLRPAVVGVWVLLFLLSVRILDVPLILGSPDTQLISVAVFRQAEKGSLEIASALGLLQAGIAFLAYCVLRLLTRKAFN